MFSIKKVAHFRFIVALVLTISILTSPSYACVTSNVETISNSVNTSLSNVSLKHFYYEQLNSTEKAIYDYLINSKEDFLNGKEITIPFYLDEHSGLLCVTNTIRRAFKAFTYENPEVEIWFNSYDRRYYYQDGYFLHLLPKPINQTNTTLTPENIREEVAKFEAIASDFASTLSGTDADKAKQIHNWIIQHAVYDYTLSLPDTQTAYGTIVNGRSICSGFAYAFKYVSDLADLNVLYVTGKVHDKENDEWLSHAWNIILIDEQYYLVDVTFDNHTNYKPSYHFLLSPVNNELHYIDTYYFDYPFKQ